LHKVRVVAFWKGGKKASSKTMELGRGTHDKGEREPEVGSANVVVPQGVGVIGGGSFDHTVVSPKQKQEVQCRLSSAAG
jgi:hypothetical protein